MVKYVETTYDLIPAYLRCTDLYQKLSALKNIEDSSLLVYEFPNDVTVENIGRVILAIDIWGFIADDLDPTLEDLLAQSANNEISLLGCNFLSDRLYFKVVNTLLRAGTSFQRVAKNLMPEYLPLGYKDIIIDTMCIYSKEFLNSWLNYRTNDRIFGCLGKLISLLYTYYKNNDFESYSGVEKITNTGDLFDKIRFLLEIVQAHRRPFFYMDGDEFQGTPLTLEEHIVFCVLSSSRPFTGYESGIIQMVRSSEMPASIEKMSDEHNKLDHIRKLYT